MFKRLAIAAAGITVSSMTYAANLKIETDDFTKKTIRYVISTVDEIVKGGAILRIHNMGDQWLEVFAVSDRSVNCRRSTVYYKVDDKDAVPVSDAEQLRSNICSFAIRGQPLVNAKTFAVRVPMYNGAPLVLSIDISGEEVQNFFKESSKKPE